MATGSGEHPRESLVNTALLSRQAISISRALIGETGNGDEKKATKRSTITQHN